jgi:glucose uptake protein GlcU
MAKSPCYWYAVIVIAGFLPFTAWIERRGLHMMYVLVGAILGLFLYYLTKEDDDRHDFCTTMAWSTIYVAVVATAGYRLWLVMKGKRKISWVDILLYSTMAVFFWGITFGQRFMSPTLFNKIMCPK